MKNHISISQIKMYLRCPLQYKFRYVDDLIIPPTGTITLGKTMHTTLETNYIQKIETKQDLSLSHVMDIFSDTWNKEVENTTFEEEEKPGEVKDQGIGLLGLYHAKISPKIQPVHVIKAIHSGVFYPNENFMCPVCGYKDLCKKW